jgi:hypothetical protein
VNRNASITTSGFDQNFRDGNSRKIVKSFVEEHFQASACGHWRFKLGGTTIEQEKNISLDGRSRKSQMKPDAILVYQKFISSVVFAS